MSDEDIEIFNCCTCGIRFGISKSVTVLWRAGKKSFFCPNSHPLAFSDETPDQKELKTLRASVKELTEKLAQAVSDLEIQKKRNTELESELEIFGIQTSGNNLGKELDQ